jgi:hypothetical protein
MKHLVLLLFFACCFHAISAQEVIIEVSAAKHTPRDVQVHLSKPLSPSVTYQLKNTATGHVVPAQLLDSTTLVFMLETPLAPGTTRSYVLTTTNKKFKPAVKIEPQQNGLLVKVKNKPVFFYHTKEAMPPADSPAYYRRSGFIHPLYSPDGNVLTDDFPAGHAHQHGIFLTWVNTTFRGQKVDFWNQHQKTGTVEHVEVLEVKEGPVFSRIKTKLRHVSLAHGPVLEETWTLTIYPLSAEFMFDLESEQVNITSDTLFINKYHYGGLAFRGSKEWNRHDKVYFKNNWQILTSEGKDTTNANHSHARWVDASGKLNGKVNGLTIFSAGDNFRYPQAIRVHPDMPYWCFAPMVDSAFTLTPGKPYRSKYRFFVHSGTATVPVREMLAEDWQQQPIGRIKEAKPQARSTHRRATTIWPGASPL